MAAQGVPDKASITLNFKGIGEQEHMSSGHDHFAADLFLTLTAKGECVQYGGFDYTEEDCVHRGDLGHKWWWRGASTTYVAAIRPQVRRYTTRSHRHNMRSNSTRLTHHPVTYSLGRSYSRLKDGSCVWELGDRRAPIRTKCTGQLRCITCEVLMS